MKILLAVDGSKFAKAAAWKCCEFISTNKTSRIKIVSAADTSQSFGTEPFGVSREFYLKLDNELIRAAENFVEEAKDIVEKQIGEKSTVETAVLRGSPKESIIDEAEEWEADLIVVGSHGYGFFERMLIGSVSDAILHHAPCSVLIVKIQDGEVEDSVN